jgi:hypothetical protein
MHFFKKKAVPIVTPIVISDQIQQDGYEPRSVFAYSGVSHQTVDVSSSGLETDTQKGNCCQRCCTKEALKDQALLIATVAAVVLGVVIGIALRGLKCVSGK